MTSLIREIGKSVTRAVTTIPSKSTFLENGKLIPDEFILAGFVGVI
jgi:hypothetical protein